MRYAVITILDHDGITPVFTFTLEEHRIPDSIMPPHCFLDDDLLDPDDLSVLRSIYTDFLPHDVRRLLRWSWKVVRYFTLPG